jgi:hypothetical protein
VLGAVVAGVALCSSAFDAAAQAVLLDVVGAQRFAAASAANQARDSAIALVGPIAGSMLLAARPGLPFVLDGASYVGSLLFLRRLHVGGTAATTADRYAHQLVDGVRALRADRPGLRLAILTAVLNLGLGATVFVVLGRAVAAGAGRWAGAVLALQAAGILAGSLVSAALYRRFSPASIVTVHGVLWAATFVVIATDPGVPASAVALGLMWCSAPAARTVLSGHLVARHGPRRRSRVFALIAVLSVATAWPGPLAAGYALAHGWSAALLAGIALAGLAALAGVALAPGLLAYREAVRDGSR